MPARPVSPDVPALFLVVGGDTRSTSAENGLVHEIILRAGRMMMIASLRKGLRTQTKKNDESEDPGWSWVDLCRVAVSFNAVTVTRLQVRNNHRASSTVSEPRLAPNAWEVSLPIVEERTSMSFSINNAAKSSTQFRSL
jgi:hypothetical protein